ncbi:MAG: dTDP-4-dehydrorhamnose reductase [Pontiella sp.]
MRKILITGSKGQLGRDCLDVFKDIFRVYGVDLPEVDLSSREACFVFLDAKKPDVIVNCAAYTAVDACETDPSCWKANRDLPGHLSEWTEKNGAFLVHISTDYVFSGDKPFFQSLEEDDLPNPLSEYGRSKLAGERIIAEHTERFSILRTAWLYGAHGNNFLKTMLRLTLQNPGKEFKVVNDQFGSPTWSYSLALQIRSVVEMNARGLFHATSEGYCSWYDFACAFLDEMKIEHAFVPCSTEEFSTPTQRPANSILENSRANQLGINIFSDWREELGEFVKQYKEPLKKEAKGL